MQFFSVYCEEDRYRGQWHVWFVEQVVAVGWAPRWFSYEGKTKNRGWTTARNVISTIEVGDRVVARLPDNRIGRIGEVTGLAIGDQSWSPTVPPSKQNPEGENGRRIKVRWDFAYGPVTPDRVVSLPPSARLTKPSQTRTSACRLQPEEFRKIEAAAKDEANWESLLPGFGEERAMSGYIAAFPHKLQSGMQPHPKTKVREEAFDDGTRPDVLLVDHQGAIVVVECKQTVPSVEHLEQTRRYMEKAKKKWGGRIRGILVHGGSRKLPDDVRRECKRAPIVELVQYSVEVTFTPCG